jgi:uncharacterized LabA/DUF88 family protein
MDVELAVDAMGLAEQIDQMVLFSGDGNFRSLIRAMQRHGVRVIVVSTVISHPAMVPDELRRRSLLAADRSPRSTSSGRSRSTPPRAA